jgi:hypothetical protein
LKIDDDNQILEDNKDLKIDDDNSPSMISDERDEWTPYVSRDWSYNNYDKD